MWPPMFPCGTTQGYAYVARAVVWPCHTVSSGLKASLGALLIDLKNPVIYIFKDFTVDLDLCIDLDDRQWMLLELERYPGGTQIGTDLATARSPPIPVRLTPDTPS